VNWVCTVESQSDALVNINILKLNTNKKYRISCPLVNIKNHNKVFLEIYSDLKVYRGNSLKISGNSSSLMYALPVNSYFITLIDPKIELIGNKDASEIGRENRYFLTQMIGMQAYEYQEILKKNKKFIKISNSYKEQEISKFFKELDSYGKSDEVVKGQDFIIGENMMPHSGSLFLTFFINMKTGKTYYFKYEDCFTGVVCSDILVFGADETSRTDHSIDYTIPNEIRKWFKNKFGPRAEDRMVLGQ
jgi:hypothetical protein